jgi:nitric oxide reductase NorE protein
MENKTTNTKSPYYPPGGILIWIIVFLEFITFSAALMVFLNMRSANSSLFNASQEHLNSTLGMINTIVLITSGLFMASGMLQLKAGNAKKSQFYLIVTIALGLLFLVLKSFEYYEKIALGINLKTDAFFLFYWLLTGFHFLHVLVAVILLSYMWLKIKSGYYTQSNHEDVETVGVFWHMCDLIWIFLFPILYLLH